MSIDWSREASRDLFRLAEFVVGNYEMRYEVTPKDDLHP